MKRLGRKVYLDASDALTLDAIITDGVARSDVLVLVLTEHVLERPWCLLEAYEVRIASSQAETVAVGRNGHHPGCEGPTPSCSAVADVCI